MKRKLLLLITPWVLLVIFLSLTHPAKIPVYVLLVPLSLFGWGVYGVLRLTIASLSILTPLQAKSSISIITLLTLISVGLQSVGQLTLKDFIVVVLLLALGYFYLYRNTFSAKNKI